jgi:AraC-like DNA-binding protein
MEIKRMPYKIENREYDFTAQKIRKLLPEPHIHPHLEFIYLKKGSGIAVIDNKEYFINEGECFLVFPNQIHFYHAQNPLEGYMMIFLPEIFEEFKEVFRKKTPIEPVWHKPDIQEDLESQLECIFEKRNSGLLYDEYIAKGFMLAILAQMFSKMEFRENPADQDAIKRILKFCVEHYMEPIGLEMMAKELYLNKHYISYIFKERMNVNYKDFVNRLRVEHACNMLTKDTPITECAYASGFSSVRTFNRAFLKYMEMSPRDYKKQKSNRDA